MHAITYPISDTHYSWAYVTSLKYLGLSPTISSSISRREAETKETWRAVDDTMLQKLKEDPASSWGFGAGELFKNAEKIVKYGLYDRPELKTWYKGRVVLLGDAAHPTSPVSTPLPYIVCAQSHWHLQFSISAKAQIKLSRTSTISSGF